MGFRVTAVRIGNWRGFQDYALEVPTESSLVCLVGANGSGKSSLLELLSAAAQRIGVLQGLDLARGDALNDAQETSVSFRFTGSHYNDLRQLLGGDWDGSVIASSNERQFSLVAPGATNQHPNAIRGYFHEQQKVNYLFLDANRSYPPKPVRPNEWLQAFEYDVLSPGFNWQWSHRQTQTLYEEWIKYLVRLEQMSATEHTARIRTSRDASVVEPPFQDPFVNYADSVIRILPHLRFIGVSSRERTAEFMSHGQRLNFNDLSGGEREIAFLLGQVDRFRLREGVLAIDEPELHLHPSLLRRWVAYLQDAIDDGQVWLATHSLEASEVAGPSATFILGSGRKTGAAVSASAKPLLPLLSATLGSPAFSLQDKVCLYVEGDRGLSETQRFSNILDSNPDVLVMEGGGCAEVQRRVELAQELSEDVGLNLQVCGVVDRDFTREEVSDDVHILSCHEVENIYLYPPVLDAIAQRNGLSALVGTDLVRSMADRFAGKWLVEWFAASDGRPLDRGYRKSLGSRQWTNLSPDYIDSLDLPSGDGELVLSGLSAYSAAREEDDFWAVCLGKEVLPGVATSLGYAHPQFLERHCQDLWGLDLTPPPVERLRSFVHERVSVLASPGT